MTGVRFGKLILRNLTRARARTLLTVLGVAMSVFIFAALLSLDHGVQRMIETTGDDSVITVFEKYKACPPFSHLPVHYGEKIAGIEGVDAVMPVRFLLSTCGTTTDLVAVHGVDPAVLREFMEINISDEQYSAFASEKGAAICGRQVAAKYGWQVGQQVSLPQLNGISFALRGIYDAPGSSANQLVLVDRVYLDQSQEQQGIVTLFRVRVADASQVGSVSRAIDANFANYETQTKSSPEKSFIAAMIHDFKEMVSFSQLIAYAALVLLLAAVVNSVSMSVRDRLREMAILKLLGFDSERVVTLVTTETALLGLLAAFIGAGLAWALTTFANLSISVEGFTIRPWMSGDVIFLALGAGLSLGFFGAWFAARGSARQPIIAALREVD
ncbi:ABC transporter permease [bacterium]|nr:ABC transporter permease [bacterium]